MAFLGIGLLSVGIWPAASGPTSAREPKRVVGGKGFEYFGVQRASYVGWTEGPYLHPERDIAIVRHGKERSRIQPEHGGAVLNDIYGTTAIYSLTTKHDSDIKFFDLETKKTRNPPRGVNTSAMEKRGTRSDDFLLFSRIHFSRRYLDYRYAREQVVLFNLKTRRKRLLADARTTRDHYAIAGQVNGEWAVWYQCTGRICEVRRMNLATRKVASSKTKRPVEYAPSVTSEGTVFFAASGYVCGTRVQLYRWPPGSGPQVVYNEGKKIDTISTYALTLADGTERVIFDLLKCANETGDVYRMDFAPRSPSPSPSSSPSPAASPSSCGLPVCPSLSPPVAFRS